MITQSISIINSMELLKNKLYKIEPYINSINIDISMLTIGIYIVHIEYNNKSISYKFEKVR